MRSYDRRGLDRRSFEPYTVLNALFGACGFDRIPGETEELG